MFLGLVIVLFFACYYVAWRLWSCLRHFCPKLPRWVSWAAAGVFAALLVMAFLRARLPRFLGSISVYFMGIFIYLFLCTLLSELVLLALQLWKKPQALHRAVAMLCAIGLALGVSCYGFVQGARLQLTESDITVSKAMDDSVHIVLLSDLHLGAEGSEARLAHIVRQVNGLKPDLICIAGDLFDSDFAAIQDPDRVRSLLQSLDATYGVYACLGNHDAGGTVRQMVDFLETAQVQLLADEYAVIDDRLLLVGRLDGTPIGGTGDLPRRTDLETALSGGDTDLPVVVMDHNPSHVGEYGQPVDLVLCGHTHQGQLFPANIITDLLYAVDYGHYEKGGVQAIVTSGAGTWGMPMRVGTQCEIVSITLHS